MQSKFGSFLESCTNVVIGIFIGFVANIAVLPAFGYPVTLGDAVWISIVFTVISLLRSYVIRRVYNKYNFGSKTHERIKFTVGERDELDG